MKSTCIISILILILIGLFPAVTVAEEEEDDTKRISFAAVPIINYSNTIGASFGLMGQMFYKTDKNDRVSPSSSTGIMGIYAENGTYFAAIFQRLYLKEDTWRLMFAAGPGNINYQYWQEIGGGTGTFIGFNTGATFAMGKAERKIYKDLYAGIKAAYSKAETYYDLPEDFPDWMKSEKVNMSHLGYLFNLDRREHQINPYGGYNISFSNNFYRESFGSDYEFEDYEIVYNHYYLMNNDEHHILATRMKADIATGDVPFQGQKVVGQEDIRGYSNGRYRDNQVYSMQAEYRHRFENRFGMVVFFGLATAVEKFSDISNAKILPGGGLGLRYMMIPKERINIGVDIAKGDGDWGLYFRIGESFR